MSVWSRVVVWILDHPVHVVAFVIAGTIVLGLATLRLETDHTAGSFVARDAEFLHDLEAAQRVFGRSETNLFVVFHDVDPSNPAFLHRLDSLTRHVEGLPGIQSVLSMTNVPSLNRMGDELVTGTSYDPSLDEEAQRDRIENQPFLRGLLLAEDQRAGLMIVRIDPSFNDTPERVDLVNHIQSAAAALPGELALAGFPYLRTQYATRVTRETPLFTVLALLVSLLFLFLTFRSWQAVLLPTVIVCLGLIWTFGLMALFGQKLNIVTAVLPALLVIIGMANAIHLSTKFFDQYAKIGERREAMLETVRTVGVATFLTCVTTAVGFAVLLLSGNELLLGFGVFAAAGILLLYLFSITLIPITYVRFGPPRPVGFATHDLFSRVFDRTSSFAKRRAPAILLATGVLVAVGIAGALRISTDVFVFSDFRSDDPLRRDLAIYEEKFGGVLPMEVIIESDREGRFRTLESMRRIEEVQQALSELEPVGSTLSAVDLMKMGNQAYFGGHPGAHRLPSPYELPFLQEAIGRFLGAMDEVDAMANLPLLVDSTFRMARIYLGVADVGTTRMNALADSVAVIAGGVFVEDEFDVVVTGTAITSTRSGESLVRNLIGSLSAALVIISLLMAVLFRSRVLTLVSLTPNVVPLLLVAGAMGFAGITLKPSTALIFPLAFGIAVDDSIHFLAKYRVHRAAGLARDVAIHRTLRETGKAILFTSFILMGGFLVFTLSSFGGTVNLGALTALTLAVALAANVLILPALLYRFGPVGTPARRRSAVRPSHVSTAPDSTG